MKWFIFIILISFTSNEDMRLMQASLPSGKIQYPGTDNLSIWATGCWHTPKDVAIGSRYPFTESYNQINGVVPYDLILSLGDFESSQTFPTGGDTATIAQVKQDIDIINESGKIYPVAGNHDGGNANMNWYKAAVWDYINHSGEPFKKLGQKVGWEWERYYMKIGNVMIIMMSDRNDLPYPVGRGGSVESGGHPSGAITQETFDWMTSLILANQDYNIFVAHHNLPRETTVATGINEGDAYHGSSGIPEGRGALWSIFNEGTQTSDDGTQQFSDFFINNPNSIVAHLGAHTHVKVNVSHFGRGIYETQNGIPFLNIGNLTVFHGATNLMHPYSSFFNFTNGSKNLNIKIYKHDTQDFPQGYYAPGEINITMKYAYNPNYK